jgi:hypothetical protein
MLSNYTFLAVMSMWTEVICLFCWRFNSWCEFGVNISARVFTAVKKKDFFHEGHEIYFIEKIVSLSMPYTMVALKILLFSVFKLFTGMKFK